MVSTHIFPSFFLSFLTSSFLYFPIHLFIFLFFPRSGSWFFLTLKWKFQPEIMFQLLMVGQGSCWQVFWKLQEIYVLSLAGLVWLTWNFLWSGALVNIVATRWYVLEIMVQLSPPPPPRVRPGQAMYNGCLTSVICTYAHINLTLTMNRATIKLSINPPLMVKLAKQKKV